MSNYYFSINISARWIGVSVCVITFLCKAVRGIFFFENCEKSLSSLSHFVSTAGKADDGAVESFLRGLESNLERASEYGFGRAVLFILSLCEFRKYY